MVTMKMIMAKMKTMLLRTIHSQRDVHVWSYDHFLHDSKTMESLTKTKTQVKLPWKEEIIDMEIQHQSVHKFVVQNKGVILHELGQSLGIPFTSTGTLTILLSQYHWPQLRPWKQVKVTVNKWSSIKSLKLVWTSETTLNLLSCKVWKI